jgi:hypothetical protein
MTRSSGAKIVGGDMQMNYLYAILESSRSLSDSSELIAPGMDPHLSVGWHYLHSADLIAESSSCLGNL